MEFDNELDVPLPVGETWRVLLDIERIATCLPGAELTEVIDDKTYAGKVAVRLGPIALSAAFFLFSILPKFAFNLSIIRVPRPISWKSI